MPREYDAFISHVSVDKRSVAGPLCDVLSRLGFRIWLDVNELTIGDSLREKIDEGLARSRYGIVVLSPSFFHRGWPLRELNGLTAREVDGKKIILPIWHGVDREYILKYSPPLADRVAANTASKTINEIAQELARVLGKPEPKSLDPVEDLFADHIAAITVNRTINLNSQELAKLLGKPEPRSLDPAKDLFADRETFPIEIVREATFEELFNYARRSTGMRKGAEAAREFAEAWEGRLTTNALRVYVKVFQFAASPTGLSRTHPGAEIFADKWIEDGRGESRFYTYQDAFNFAHSKDGMGKGIDSAEEFAEDWVMRHEGLDFEKFKSLYLRARKGMSKSREDSEELAFDKLYGE